MATGTVKWFSDKKGFGFIKLDDGQEAFVHHSEIEGEGFRSLEEGDKVECEVGKGPKGPQATKVRKI